MSVDRPPITGHELIELINNPEKRRKPIIDGLAYERSCVMFGSQPGVGKSLLSLQAALEISAGLPVFGAFASKPTKVYYIQKERTIDEVLERVEAMQRYIAWNPSNLIIDSELQTFSLANPRNSDWIIDRVATHKPGLIQIDPIGSGSPGLSTDEGGNDFCTFLTKLQSRVGACHWINHHSVKDTYSSDGRKIEKDDPFYGSQWIKAHVTGSFLVTQNSEGTTLVNKKDNHSNLMKSFTLAYDPETMLSTAKVEQLTTVDRIKQYCNAHNRLNKTFSFNEIMHGLGVSRSTLRGHLSEPLFLKFLKRHKSSGKPTLYEVLEEF